MENYLTEAFKKMSVLNEDAFDVSEEGSEELKKFLDGDTIDDVEEIIDPLAETEEDLQDTYVGKVILDCAICQSKIYKDQGDVIIDEEQGLANVGEECPFCQSSDGYKVIGQVAPYKPEDGAEDTEENEDDVEINIADKDVEEAPKAEEKEEKEEPKTESFVVNIRKRLQEIKASQKTNSIKEELQNVEIETENEKITVTSEPKNDIAGGDEMIAPITDDVKADIEANTEEEPVEEPVEDPGFEDIDVDEFDETEFDELGEKYLRKVYENVESYKTVSGTTQGNFLKLEGVIKFKSGKEAKTNFVFESKTVTKTGKLKFEGMNKQIAKGNKSFTLTGRMKGNKLCCESLTYNYKGRDFKSGKTQRLYGTVSRVK